MLDLRKLEGYLVLTWAIKISRILAEVVTKHFCYFLTINCLLSMIVILSIWFSYMKEISEYEQKRLQKIEQNELELLKTGFVSTQTALTGG